MGWWGFGALSGDSPLDCLGFIADELKVEFDIESRDINNFGGYPFTKEMLEENLVKIQDYIKTKGSREVHYYHVLGALCLYYGVTKIPRDLKAQILIEITEDEWAKDDPDRRKYMDLFYKAFKNHKKGQRLKMVYEGEDNPKNGSYESIFHNSMKIMKGD